MSKETKTFEELIDTGRQLLGETESRNAIDVFRVWDEEVVLWLDKEYPSSGLSAEWTILVGLDGATWEDVAFSPTHWHLYYEKIRERLKFLLSVVQMNKFIKSPTKQPSVKAEESSSKKVFIVHGHNEKVKMEVAGLLSKLDLEPIILHDQANKGRTIIEKFEDHSDVAFAVVLLTADDKGGKVGAPVEEYLPRARQNVIMELGFFLAKLGRKLVCPLLEDSVEKPSDYDGVLYVSLDKEGAWKTELAKEIKASGLPVDLNNL